MKKHRMSWPPRRERDRLASPAADLHAGLPGAAATGPAVHELGHVAGSAS
jgi:hypothetical protein